MPQRHWPLASQVQNAPPKPSVIGKLPKTPNDPSSLGMPRPSRTSSATTSVLLCLAILLAFFPGAFHFIWTLPLSLLGLTGPASSPQSDRSYYSSMTWFQKQFTLPTRSRGSYLITDEVLAALPQIREYKVGLLNLFVQHTSCALSLNENC